MTLTLVSPGLSKKRVRTFLAIRKLSDGTTGKQSSGAADDQHEAAEEALKIVACELCCVLHSIPRLDSGCSSCGYDSHVSRVFTRRFCCGVPAAAAERANDARCKSPCMECGFMNRSHYALNDKRPELLARRLELCRVFCLESLLKYTSMCFKQRFGKIIELLEIAKWLCH